MRENIFTPLRMERTRPDSNTEAISDRVTAYFPRFAAEPRYGPDVSREIDYPSYAGSAAFLSTPSELVRFAIGITSGKLLQPDTVKLLQASQRLASGETTGYGLGWQRQSATIAGVQTPLVGHDGTSMGGMVGSFMAFPEYGIVVSVTANISYADTHTLAVKIAEAFVKRGKPPISQ